MDNFNWLDGRIQAGEELLINLKELSAGPARRSDDAGKQEILEVRGYLGDFAKWDSENVAALTTAFQGDRSRIDEYRNIEVVDRQLAMTDFATVKGRLQSTVIAKSDVLRSIRTSILRDPSAGAGPAGRVFIGHGRSSAWRELKDHLRYDQKLWTVS